MKTFSRLCISLSFVGAAMVYAPISAALPMAAPEPPPQPWDIDAPAPQIPIQSQSYGERVSEKALSGFANITTGMLEIPKNIINTTNQSNVIYGFIGGMAKGMVHTAGRFGVGLADLLTFPIATKPIAYPYYVWDNFDAETVYGDVMRLQPVAVKTVAPPPPEPEVVAPPPAPQAPEPAPVNYGTNQKIDAIFKDEMRK